MAIRFTKMHGLGNDYVFVDVYGGPEANGNLVGDRGRRGLRAPRPPIGTSVSAGTG